jgi:prophage antirepressor-like protein
MNNLIPFKFENRDVRIVMIDGAEWWVGRDVTKSLGFKDAVNAIKQHFIAASRDKGDAV